MSAKVLRETAALMRERAEAAVQPLNSPGWIIDREDPFALPTEVYRGPVGCGDVASAADAATAEHIASWHPDVALAVADLLDAVADEDWCCDECKFDPDNANVAVKQSLDLARAYLGVSR